MNEDKLFPATLMPDKDWWQTLWPDPTGVLRNIGIASGMDVVDLCCGDGHFTAPLCRLTTPGKTIGIDLDPDLLDKAKLACETADNFTALLGDARDLPDLLTTLVDLVFLANTFHGVSDQTNLARIVCHALKPGGCFAVINWHQQPREETTVLGQPRGPSAKLRMTPENVVRVVEPAGLNLETVVDVGPYHYGAVFIKPLEM